MIKNISDIKKEAVNGVWLNVFPRSAMYLEEKGDNYLVKEIEVSPIRFKGRTVDDVFVAQSINVDGFGAEKGIGRIDGDKNFKVKVYEYECQKERFEFAGLAEMRSTVCKYDKRAESELVGLQPGDVSRRLKDYIIEKRDESYPVVHISIDRSVDRGAPKRTSLTEAKKEISIEEGSVFLYKV